MSTVKVVKSQKTGLVLNTSTRNPEQAWVMVRSEEKTTKRGFIFTNVRTGFLRSDTKTLESYKFTEGQELPGHVVIQDQLVPIMKDNAEFGLRVPQSKQGIAYTAAIGTAIRTACSAAGVAYSAMPDVEIKRLQGIIALSEQQKAEGVSADKIRYITNTEKQYMEWLLTKDPAEVLPVYRSTFYSPYPEGHPSYEDDVIITPDNLEQVNAFIATIALPVGNATGVDSNAKQLRMAELKAIAKAKRTAEEKAELAVLIEEFE